jgi:serine/threonine-protein kinase
MDPRSKPPDDAESRGGAGATASSEDGLSDSSSSQNGIPRPLDPQSFPAAVASFGPALSLSRLPPVARGAYTIEGALAQGGAGKILRARDERLGRTVALKVMRFDPSGPDAERFVREVMITAKLQHPSIVALYEAGRWPSGEPFYTMELVEGRSLAEVSGERPALADRLALVAHVIDAADAVAYAHSRGILHRDLKPDNVMIGAFGEVYVLDWGIAVSLDPDPSGRLPAASEATDLVGTPAYMAPEMVMGDPSLLSPRTDVYLLGAILHEIVAGKPPHEGPTVHAMLSSVLLSSLKLDDFPPELCTICARALARDPKDRYESADALRVALEDLLRHRGSARLALEAEDSRRRLDHVLATEPPGEERTLAVFHLLGECRFGYRAALSAWPENGGARAGLDQALLAVVDHELGEGDPGAAAALLREVSSPPPDVASRVDAAVRARAGEDERLRRLEEDADPTIGSRTRIFISTIFGFLWAAVPLGGWLISLSGKLTVTHEIALGWSVFFFALSLGLFVWARDTMTKTLYNRRLVATLALHLGTQVLLSGGAWVAGLRPEVGLSFMMLGWSIVETMLAVWVEPWFGVPAFAAGAGFFVSLVHPAWVLPTMAASSLVLTVMIVRVWFPKQDLERIHARRKEVRRRARKWILDLGRGPLPPDKPGTRRGR